jgi:hypothetical protein
MLALFLVVFVVLFVSFKLAWWAFKLTLILAVATIVILAALILAAVRALRA